MQGAWRLGEPRLGAKVGIFFDLRLALRRFFRVAWRFRPILVAVVAALTLGFCRYGCFVHASDLRGVVLVGKGHAFMIFGVIFAPAGGVLPPPVWLFFEVKCENNTEL